MKYTIVLTPGKSERILTYNDNSITVNNGDESDNEILAALYPSIFIEMETLTEAPEAKTIKEKLSKLELLIEEPVEVEIEVEDKQPVKKPARKTTIKKEETKPAVKKPARKTNKSTVKAKED